MILIPAIDLKDGMCVRLRQGDFSRVTVYGEDPAAMATHWCRQGATRIHVVDLDGSRAGEPRNRGAVQDIVRTVPIPVEVGGGIRTLDTIADYLELGVRWVILGTAAMKNASLLEEACRRWPGRIILGLDAADGRVAVEAWTESTAETAIDLARRYESLALAAIVYTDIRRDGMEVGVNVAATKLLAESLRLPVIASGGVAGIGDIERLLEIENAGVMGVIIGKALYTGAISLPEALRLQGGSAPAASHGG
ncbi:MAG TPA: 1-(5-phosphoribosyl)-5-[(5-phosphoribosylamino)methylideneamino]imidazole-4-carboxamide isomerase [Syntrophus sp. (in: bacteria)]|nr:1-(5-phosphoribosyl)-5-[(5-phosphoribosylamino)methylideneamino]imidazole-4-carboxamide isomerase [Syntrophus sp. (in: bacteria)]